MSEPFLIAHLVRGEPAFDIAIKMDVETEDEPWFIIPTSGHRAYPYWHEELWEVINGNRMDLARSGHIAPPPPNWPDHYAVSAAPKGQGLVKDLLSVLGLRKTVERRL